MSFMHSDAIFKHSCINVPIDPTSKLPSALYERWSQKVNEGDIKKFNECIEMPSRTEFRKKQNTFRDLRCSKHLSDFKSLESFLYFYENIPDFSDLNHLSDEEFDLMLRKLKAAQKKFCSKSDSSFTSMDQFSIGDDVLSVGTCYNSSNDSAVVKTVKPKLEAADFSSNKVSNKSSSRLEPTTTIFTEKLSPMNNTSDVNLLSVDNFKSNCHSKSRNHDHLARGQKTPSVLTFKVKSSLKSGMDKMSSSLCSTPEQDSDTNKSFDKINRNYDKTKESVAENNMETIAFISNIDSCSSLLDNNWDKTSNDLLVKRSDDDIDYFNEQTTLWRRMSQSLPGSPLCKRKSRKFTVPKPFKMTLREKESKEYLGNGCHLHNQECTSCPHNVMHVEQKNMVKAHPIPFHSRIPLYDKIMAEQESRRIKNHKRYSKDLRSSMRPFSFTKRDEKAQRTRLTCSNPDLSLSPAIRSHSSFRAKPVPKAIFSDYAYEKMREDEFYRALKKRVRAEEMLKSSSLPPSMAAREKTGKTKNLTESNIVKSKNFKSNVQIDYTDPEINKTEFLKSKKFSGKKSSWLFSSRNKPIRRHSTPDSSTELSAYETTPEPESRSKIRSHSSLSVNRSNLASLLRFQTCRKRLEDEMNNRLEEDQMKEEARFKARLVRMTPAWRALNYSTEEDLAMRVATRREEEKLRRDQHKQLMESIYGRVHCIPPLFERQIKNKKFQVKNTRKYNDKDERYQRKNSCSRQRDVFHDGSQMSVAFMPCQSENNNNLNDYNDKFNSGNNRNKPLYNVIDETNVKESKRKSLGNNNDNFIFENYSSSDEGRVENTDEREDLRQSFYN